MTKFTYEKAKEVFGDNCVIENIDGVEYAYDYSQRTLDSSYVVFTGYRLGDEIEEEMNVPNEEYSIYYPRHKEIRDNAYDLAEFYDMDSPEIC